MDTNCVTVRLADRSIVTIDCQKVEDAFTDNIYERSELDYLLFSDTAAYADLVLNEDPGRYLKAVTQYQTDESMM
jgi:hypothetical protein